ncbi:unnamed protein product [Linum tenue]|uniref:Ribosomal RNA small subunit methyltransferase NEP1 n=1 Tax=Linum tenue TaxID=586396 RepID=A0AAV0M800_9ROSI|nr:unnamed protein product [Linum tenue]
MKRKNGEGIKGGEEKIKVLCLEQASDEPNPTGISSGHGKKALGLGVEEVAMDLPGIALAPSNPDSKAGVIFVLEKASLVLANVGRRYRILNANEHSDYLRKKNMDPYKYRPDIVHEALVGIMDSRLRMAGKLKAVYIKTDEGILIKVEPNARIPRTLEEFCDMMAQLLQKLSIKAKGKGGKLLRLVQNPVTQYFPVNSIKIGLSFVSDKAVPIEEYITGVNKDNDLIFVVGTMAHGKIDSDYLDDLVAVSSYPLTAAACLRDISIALEGKWKIH